MIVCSVFATCQGIIQHFFDEYSMVLHQILRDVDYVLRTQWPHGQKELLSPNYFRALHKWILKRTHLGETNECRSLENSKCKLTAECWSKWSWRVLLVGVAGGVIMTSASLFLVKSIWNLVKKKLVPRSKLKILVKRRVIILIIARHGWVRLSRWRLCVYTWRRRERLWFTGTESFSFNRLSVCVCV